MRRPPSRADAGESISGAGNRPTPHPGSGLNYEANPYDPRQNQY
jgi:hypothetical protein